MAWVQCFYRNCVNKEKHIHEEKNYNVENPMLTIKSKFYVTIKLKLWKKKKKGNIYSRT